MCPECGRRMTAPDSKAGKSGACPKCHATVTAPALQPQAPEALADLQAAVEAPPAAEVPAAAPPAARVDPPVEKPKPVEQPKPAKPKQKRSWRPSLSRKPRPTRPCPACAETIQEKAVKCPRCLTWLDEAAEQKHLRRLQRWRAIKASVIEPVAKPLDRVPLVAWMLAFLLVWSLGIFLPGAMARAAAANAAAKAAAATQPAAAKKSQKTSGKVTDAAPAKGNSDETHRQDNRPDA